MASLQSCSLPGTTHGHGGDRGDEARSDGDDDAASSFVPPSFAPTNASGMPGDLDDFDEHEDILLKPHWNDDLQCSDGVWGAETRGGGEAGAEKDEQDSGPGGTYGLLSANWGANWKNEALQLHMNRDIKSGPCQVLCLQEANEELLLYLRSPLEGSAKDKRAEGNEGVKGEPRPEGQFIGVRGPDPKSGLMICARASLVLGIRLLIFHRIYDGAYRATQKRKKATTKGAVSRIMIASLKMRHVRIRGRGVNGDDAEDIDEIRIANAHLHYRTAKRELQSGAAAYKRFWDLLATYMAEFRPSLLCGDFNMALFAVIPELRARGFQISLCAWYCWQNHLETHVRADSCAIFRIGPCQGIRMCFDASVFGLPSPPLPEKCSMVMEILRDDEGKEIERRQYGVPKMGVLGQGFPLASYRPLEPKRKEQFVNWTFTHAFDALSPAVAGIIQCTKDDKAMFPFDVDNSIGSASWSWPEAPISKQKLASYDLFDPHRQFFQRGAHMPLMVYIGGSSESRRSKDARARRCANADKRGWTWAWRQTTKVESESRDGGEHWKGKQKGRGTHTHGDGEPSDGKGKGGKGTARDGGKGAKGGGKSYRHW